MKIRDSRFYTQVVRNIGSRNSIGQALTCQALLALDRLNISFPAIFIYYSLVEDKSAFKASVNACAASSADTVTSSSGTAFLARARS